MNTTQTKERPVIFSAPMIRALLDGRKTMTRRIIKPTPFAPVITVRVDDEGFPWWSTLPGFEARGVRPCPYGRIGGFLWVRETWRTESRDDDGLSPADIPHATRILYDADREWGVNRTTGRNRSPLHMPRWASRITLEITGVKVERLQDISHRDALAEGVAYDVNKPDGAPVERFKALWKSIHGTGSWQEDPWVWAISFRRVEH